MARKQRPNIKGFNPEYTTNFGTTRESTGTFAAEIPKPSAPAEPAAKQTPTPPKPDPETDTPSASKPKADKPARPRVEKERQPQAPKAPKPAAEKRETRLDAAVKVDQGKKLDALEGQGIAARDVIVLAGRRATARFELKAKYIEKPEADRLPMREGYHTTKRLPANILDDLREKHDPLRLQSDSAMVRGQFEPVFWTCLDEVIEELRQKKD
ncbi:MULTISPECIES: hypothetical protein [Rhodobacterales]|jgi:hypothetical protein|uniref:Uncharacterized protein n=1 Tax=Marivita cryptomonadis TaxID=505252 RepID=A0A9Q2NVZ3_9RHOB|nr:MULTISPECIES: hypothetical protein [Rhodobacterales]MBM1222781.1 hypothetical protein [Ponticoccus sp. SC6-9]MBM1227405.1 hypothetical protein [Ponticoccus sp. SC6-15]MBM1231707.1 hypothetical protein [Ponticoccus sp. SC6-38]MBM1236280.1 hypothetical protein [Ponticoccus sp. SC6-45]MBM1240730.1 hypothetical protein [Ponticoccus sp. SC6-49]MBM1245265.1 hypothetical protein [Ponticoccus sp. SC2-64]MBM1249753.1 hypothetical protein [Ponticoccus sp. SC6-42]MBM1254223.1 hypothetical protein [